jgi:hypothetical protein
VPQNPVKAKETAKETVRNDSQNGILQDIRVKNTAFSGKSSGKVVGSSIGKGFCPARRRLERKFDHNWRTRNRAAPFFRYPISDS